MYMYIDISVPTLLVLTILLPDVFTYNPMPYTFQVPLSAFSCRVSNIVNLSTELLILSNKVSKIAKTLYCGIYLVYTVYTPPSLKWNV